TSRVAHAIDARRYSCSMPPAISPVSITILCTSSQAGGPHNDESAAGGKIVQVLRPTSGGNVPQREKDAARDLHDATGVKQALLPTLRRNYIPKSDQGPYYRVDSALPVIEFSYPCGKQEIWNGRSALVQGRIWAGFEQSNAEFESWFNSVVRWMRKNFIKNPV